MSAIRIELPDQVHQRAAELARRRSMSLDRLMVVALVEKLSTMFSDESLEERAQQGTWQGFDEFMQGVPNVEPEDYDRLPPDSPPTG
jgi:hypothetical protein